MNKIVTIMFGDSSFIHITYGRGQTHINTYVKYITLGLLYLGIYIYMGINLFENTFRHNGVKFGAEPMTIIINSRSI